MILFTLEKDQVSNAPLNALACTSTLYIHVHSVLYVLLSCMSLYRWYPDCPCETVTEGAVHYPALKYMYMYIHVSQLYMNK